MRQGLPITGERRERILRLIREQPDASNREIARQAGVDHKTVASLRSGAPSARTAAPWSRDVAVSSFCRLLNADLAATLDDLTRILRDEVGRIAELPEHKRRAFAISYVRSLLGIDVTAALESSPMKPRDFNFALAADDREYQRTAIEDCDSEASPLSPVLSRP